jgi:4-amino-4-deoxy-L-arabinose transferase-like glycosyltransferase
MAKLRTLTIIVVLLLAFALRLYHLDFQSLEGDEGISLQRSSQPLAQMMERMPVEHVPGYFVLLWGWLRVTGEQDFALRFLSVWPSVLAVALLYRWSASMGRPVTGLIAALLLATNSFQIWYAQQARMYSWLLMTSLLSFWSLWRIVKTSDIRNASFRAQRGIPSAVVAEGEGDSLVYPVAGAAREGQTRRNDGIAHLGVDILYILSTAVTVYLHYFGFLIPLAQSVFMAIWTLTIGSWRITRRWIVNGALIFLLFLPWLGNTITFLGFQGWREPLDPWQVPWMMHRAYSVGFPMPQPWQEWLPWLYLGLALLGLLVWWRQNRAAWLLVTTATFVPFVLIFLAVLRNPDFHERYSMFLAAPWLLLIAAGFGVLLPNGQTEQRQILPRWLAVSLPALLIVALVAANGLALNRLYFDTTLHKADYRGSAFRIHDNELAGDVVLVDGPNPELVFNHYYQDTYGGQASVYDLRPLADEDDDKISETLQEDTAGANRAWEVLYFRSPGPIQFWLATHGWSSAPTDHNGIRVVLYGLDRGPLVEQEMATSFGEGLSLQRAGVEGPTARAGDLLRVTTRWQVAAPLPDYKFSLRLLTPDGQVMIADDYLPQNWFAPTSQWAVGEAVDQRALLLPADLPSGVYLVTLRLYDPTNGVPVETPAGQDVQLGMVEVE